MQPRIIQQQPPNGTGSSVGSGTGQNSVPVTVVRSNQAPPCIPVEAHVSADINEISKIISANYLHALDGIFRKISGPCGRREIANLKTQHEAMKRNHILQKFWLRNSFAVKMKELEDQKLN